jgi:Flp pilus assembly protein TadG
MANRTKTKMSALAGDTRGSVLLEAALIMPLVVLFIAGIADYGVVLYQYHTLSTANGSAVRQLIVSRGFDNPYTGVLAQYNDWAPNLSVQGNQITVSVENSDDELTPCATDTSCKALLDDAVGKQATVSIDYPCTTTFIPSMASPCPILITASGMVE